MKGPKHITKEELKGKYKDFLTVGDLKKFLEKNNLPDDAPVLAQRVEDRYFEKCDWSVYPKNDEHEGISEYHPVWGGVFYREDADILFLDMHY